MTPRVLIPIAPGSEEMEAITIVNILRRAQIDCTLAGTVEGPIRCSRGSVIVPDTTLEAVMDMPFDLIALPGGQPGTTHLDEDPRMHTLLQRMHAEGKFITAICAAPTILAHAGLLTGKKATCYPTLLDTLHGAETVAIHGVVCDGNIITSTGPGTAMDFALTLVETLVGKAQRMQVEEALARP
ncbi:DJ-1 family protein [Magnetococcus marinus MC-1]|uniref:DJ-1 family protein n=1 Tax=Magnetococcus marinus (strain ATCC BAA-1437 / JCM 17883 / MC-1) TaxID=156889 RepID=A0L6D4_MAGMM|nr:DJ-1 family glyoxalase III [Magnetococcus marinus]ABK43527.1 DJ-1 family protein [Magnetococcus marinus MC-1]